MKDFFTVVYESIITFLNENNVDYFLGGSRRFGYEIYNSDFDIMALSTNFHKQEAFLSNFNVISNSEYLFSMHYRLHVGQKHIDLLLISPSLYFNLKKEHENVAEFIDAIGKRYLEFIKQLKCMNSDISGATIYRTLLKLSKRIKD